MKKGKLSVAGTALCAAVLFCSPASAAALSKTGKPVPVPNQQEKKFRLAVLWLTVCCVAIFIGAHAGHAASPCLNQETASKSQRSKIAEIRVLERLLAKLTDDLRLLDSTQGSKVSASQKSSPSKYSLLQQKIQSLERRKTLLLADKNVNLPAAQNITAQKSRAAGRQMSIKTSTGSISGKVFNTCGDPAENVYVLASDLLMMEYPEYSGEAYTIGGSYTIGNLAVDGDYQVFIDGATATLPNCNYGYYDKEAPNHINTSASNTVKADPPNKLDDVTLTCSCGTGTGSIKGTMSGNGSAGISGHVDVYDENYKWVVSARTEDGSYEVNNLPAGNYKLFFDADTEYISQWYYKPTTPTPQDFPPGDFCTADKVSPYTGTLPVPPEDQKNVQLTKGSTISGTVKDAAATGNPPMAGVFVDVFSEKYPSLYEFDYTDVDGTYTLSGLPTGNDYKVRFKPANNFHAMQWYGDKYDFEHAEPVSPSPLPDVRLALSGSITGTVTSEKKDANDNNRPITFAFVNAESIDSSQSPKGIFSAVGTTDENGNYTISGLPTEPNWKVQFMASFIKYVDDPNNPNDDPTDDHYHVNEWYDNKHSSVQATPVAGTVPNINAQLALGGCISGKVTGVTGTTGVTVEVYNENLTPDAPVAVAATDKNGNYTVTGVPADGNNKVRFFIDSQNEYCSSAHTCYVKWYNHSKDAYIIKDAEQINVVVSANSCTQNINATVASCGSISGAVKDSKTNAFLSDVRVEVHNNSLSTAGNVIASGITDKDGKYTIIGVPVSDVHKVKFVADSIGYTNQWYNGTEDEAGAASVVVKASETTPTIDAALSKRTSAGSSAIAPIVKTLLLP